MKRLALGAGVAALVLSVSLTAIAAVPPVYEVRLNGQAAGAGRNPEALAAALDAEVDRYLDREVTLQTPAGNWFFRLRDLGMQMSPEAAAGALEGAVQALPWWQRLPWSRPALGVTIEPDWNDYILEQTLEPLRAAVQVEPVDAKLSIVERQPTITPEVLGQTLDLAALRTQLQKLGGESRLAVPLKPLAPANTQVSLESLGIRRLVAEWSTHYDPSIPRAENVERAAMAFNGLMLKPGEIVSYNAVVGPVDAANGWREAYVIVNGELVMGIGGGVCQVATTLYGAALRANLEIVERHQHQLAVAYIDPSQDAAIAQGWEDLKLRNTTLGHLWIEAEAGGGTVTFRMYGDVPDGQEVKIESKVLGSIPFETRTLTDPSLAPGKQVVKSGGSPGLRSEAYRAVFLNGELIKRELLSRDSYLPTARVILTGPVPAAPAAEAETPTT